MQDMDHMDLGICNALFWNLDSDLRDGLYDWNLKEMLSLSVRKEQHALVFSERWRCGWRDWRISNRASLAWTLPQEGVLIGSISRETLTQNMVNQLDSSALFAGPLSQTPPWHGSTDDNARIKTQRDSIYGITATEKWKLSANRADAEEFGCMDSENVVTPVCGASWPLAEQRPLVRTMQMPLSTVCQSCHAPPNTLLLVTWPDRLVGVGNPRWEA